MLTSRNLCNIITGLESTDEKIAAEKGKTKTCLEWSVCPAKKDDVFAMD
jgi:hypothetical protein